MTYIIVVGEVSARQYNPIRIKALRDGGSPLVERYPHEFWRKWVVTPIVDVVGIDGFWGDLPLNGEAALSMRTANAWHDSLGFYFEQVAGIIINCSGTSEEEVTDEAFLATVTYLHNHYPITEVLNPVLSS